MLILNGHNHCSSLLVLPPDSFISITKVLIEKIVLCQVEATCRLGCELSKLLSEASVLVRMQAQAEPVPRLSHLFLRGSSATYIETERFESAEMRCPLLSERPA